MRKRMLIFIFSTVFFVLFGISLIPVFNSSAYGTLIFKIKDPPDEWGPATAVYITSTDINIHRADMGNESGWLETGISVKNLSLGETLFESTARQAVLKVGTYNIIRFEIVQAIVTVDGKNYSCELSSGKLTIPIREGGVRVLPNSLSNLLIDINPKITGKNVNFKLVPAVTATPA